jgi:hypothetical protein
MQELTKLSRNKPSMVRYDWMRIEKATYVCICAVNTSINANIGLNQEEGIVGLY